MGEELAGGAQAMANNAITKDKAKNGSSLMGERGFDNSIVTSAF